MLVKPHGILCPSQAYSASVRGVVGHSHEVQRPRDLYVVAGRMLDGLTERKLVSILRPGDRIAENVSVERPAGVNVGFTEISIALGIGLLLRPCRHHCYSCNKRENDACRPRIAHLIIPSCKASIKVVGNSIMLLVLCGESETQMGTLYLPIVVLLLVIDQTITSRLFMQSCRAPLLAGRCRTTSRRDPMNSDRRRMIIFCAAILLAAVPVLAQNPELQQKLAAVKQAATENKQKLLQYQWIETTQLTLKGDAKPPTTNSCRYGPDGKVQKTAIGPPPEQPSGGRLKQRVIAKKKAEIKDYMQDVKALLSMYVPPDPQELQAAYQAGKVSLNPVLGAVNLIFTDYAQPKDKIALTFDTASKTITGLTINIYMGQEKDAVTLQVRMGSLPDGTSYQQQIVISATAKQLVVTTKNSNYKSWVRY